MNWTFPLLLILGMLVGDVLFSVLRNLGVFREITLYFYPKKTELPLYKHAHSHSNPDAYIKKLIREDMERTQAEQD